MARILLIEDDAALAAEIVSTLERAGHTVDWWSEGRVPDPSGLDLLVVDLMLPGMYGLDILVELRASSDLPVLVLSARNATSDRVRALELGADDYLTKPFWPEELVQRVKARLRRPYLARSTQLHVAGLKIDTEQGWVCRDGASIELTPTERSLLLILAARQGEPVTRSRLAEVLADASSLGDRNLDAHISRLRKKLGPGEVIATVWGVGYRLATKDARRP